MSIVSIITTTYKHEKYIAETIESVILQTYENWELLIGDDSPDDKTREIIQYYVDKYPQKIKAWHHKPNKGIVDNMNFLIEQTSEKSQYIAFLEGDDLFTQDNLQKKIDIFDKYSEVKLVYNNLDIIDGNGKTQKKDFFQFSNIKKILRNEKIDLSDFIISGYYKSYSSLMVDKSVFEKILIRNLSGNKVYYTSDRDFFGEVAYSYNVYGLSESLTLYRIHANNTSNNMLNLSKDLMLSMNNILRKYNIKKNNNIDYKLLNLNQYINYLRGNRLKTLKYGFMSFRYGFKSNFFERLGMMFLTLLPKKLNNYLYSKLKK